MPKRVNLSLTPSEARMVNEALARAYVWRLNAAVRVSLLRAPAQESLAEEIASVQRRLAVQLEKK